MVERLRKYENLMKKHGVHFEPLDHDNIDDHATEKTEEREEHSTNENDGDEI